MSWGMTACTKQLGITAAWGKCWLSQSQSYMCVIMGILMQCMPSLIWVNEGACEAAGATLLTGCMDSLILALSIACVLVLALVAILLPTGKAQDDFLSPAQQQRQRSIYRAAAERSRRQWHARRNRRSLLDNAHPATAASEKNTTGHSVRSSTLRPSKWHLTAIFLLYLLLWPSAASLHAIATSALDRSVAVSASIRHTGEVCESMAQSHRSMCPRYTLASLAPEEERSCLPQLQHAAACPVCELHQPGMAACALPTGTSLDIACIATTLDRRPRDLVYPSLLAD